MRHSYKILFFFCLITTISNGQISEYSKLANIEPVRDVGFEYFARGVQAMSNRVQSNNNEAYSILERVQEVYENKLDEGCGSDFKDFYFAKHSIIINKVNSGKIDIATSNGVNNYRVEMYSLERELNRYNCNQKSSSNTQNYTSTFANTNYSTETDGFPQKRKNQKYATLWDSCDWRTKNIIGKVEEGTEVTIGSICTNSVKNHYFVTLPNGKSGYISCVEMGD